MYRPHASADGHRGAAARAAALRGARAVPHLPVERLHVGAALPCDRTVGSMRKGVCISHMRQCRVYM